MPKVKTHSGAKKRFKVTGSGKIKHSRQGMRHQLRNKTKKQKRHLRGMVVVSPAESDRIKAMLNI